MEKISNNQESINQESTGRLMSGGEGTNMSEKRVKRMDGLTLLSKKLERHMNFGGTAPSIYNNRYLNTYESMGTVTDGGESRNRMGGSWHNTHPNKGQYWRQPDVPMMQGNDASHRFHHQHQNSHGYPYQPHSQHHLQHPHQHPHQQHPLFSLPPWWRTTTRWQIMQPREIEKVLCTQLQHMTTDDPLNSDFYAQVWDAREGKPFAGFGVPSSNQMYSEKKYGKDADGASILPPGTLGKAQFTSVHAPKNVLQVTIDITSNENEDHINNEDPTKNENTKENKNENSSEWSETDSGTTPEPLDTGATETEPEYADKRKVDNSTNENSILAASKKEEIIINTNINANVDPTTTTTTAPSEKENTINEENSKTQPNENQVTKK